MEKKIKSYAPKTVIVGHQKFIVVFGELITMHIKS